MTQASVSCGECGGPLPEPTDLRLGERSPCHECKSLRRAMRVNVSCSAAVHTGFAFIQRRPGFRRRGKIHEAFAGVVSSHTFGHVCREWSRDRGNDSYRERVTTLDGTVVHECEEPLSRHQEHGDDRPKRALLISLKRTEPGGLAHPRTLRD
jgi:hypothetical protein